MDALAEVLEWINLGLFVLVALVAVREWRIRRLRAGLWAALAFVGIAVVVVVGRVLPEEPQSDLELVVERLNIAVLVLFPYLLYRFSAAFRPPPGLLERSIASLTAVMLVWTFLLPSLPGEGEPRPGWFVAYLFAFLFHWTVLTVIVALRLWRAGRGEPAVARTRMRLLAVAAVALTVALLIAVVGGGAGGERQFVTDLFVTVSALGFLLGLSPPYIARILWRRPEQRQLQAAIADLMAATTPEQVAERVLEPMARIVGARAVALWGADGAVVGAYGATPELIEAAERDEPVGADGDVLRFEIPAGRLVVWRSRYAPFFGSDELATLRTLGALTGLALDRSRLFAHQRNFIALAAHELRTPVASIHGVAQTIEARRDELTTEQTAELQEVLRRQTARLAILVEQLLDLSRLEVEAVELRPERFRVRDHVEELVTAVAGERAGEIAVEIPADLEAETDRSAFDRVVANLVGNALRYGAPPIVVHAERRDRHFRVSVEDRGPGVRPEFVPSLFERFSRSEASREDAPGSGLGLAIARSYARAQSGELVYEPAQPHGARFELVLPAASR